MKINRILAAAVAVGIAFSALLTIQRFDRESDYKTYEVNMYYSELEKVASQEGVSMDDMLEDMKDTGITNMLIKEDTLQSLKQNPAVSLTTRMSGYDLIIESEDSALIQRIYRAFMDVKKDDRSVTLEDDKTIRIEGTSLDYIEGQVLTVGSYGQKNVTSTVWSGSMLETVGLGYDEKALELSKKHGFGVILSPNYYADFQSAEKSVDAFLDTIDSSKIEPSHIIFSGNQVIGFDYPEMKRMQDEAADAGIKKFVYPPLEKLATGLEDRDIAVAMIESSSQGGYLKTDGMMELLKLMDFDAVGSYLTWDFVTNKYDYEIPFHHNGEEIANIMFRGITTRNIRVISLKPFIKDGRYISDPQAYANVLDNIEKRLAAVDMKPARLKTMEFFSPNPLLRIPVAMGIIAAWLMIIDNLFAIKKKKSLYILLGLGTAASAALIASGMMSAIVEKGFALLGAMTMPSLAGCWLISRLRRIENDLLYTSKAKAFLKSELMMLGAILITLGSVLFEVAMLTHSRYLLGVDTFAGVKISQVVPMGIILLMYIAYFGYRRNPDSEITGITSGDVLRFANDTIKVWQIAAIGIFAAVLMIFMARSGNAAPEPSAAEVLMRNFFEFIFPARPRTKAIFAGIPFTVIMLYLSQTGRNHKMNIAFVVLSSIGLVNTVNTFSHTKAALTVSVFRTGAELFVGSLVALAGIIMIEAVIYICGRMKDKMKNEKGSVLNGL